MDVESSLVEVEEDELRRIAGAEARRRCSGLKLAARIVGMATANGSSLDDSGVVQSMADVLTRLSTLRQAGLAVVGVERGAPDFPAVFNAVTASMLDVVTEEWKWSRLSRGGQRLLPVSVLSKLLEACIHIQPERFSPASGGLEMSTSRRLAVMDCAPKLLGLVNMFDYYQADQQAMLSKLMRAVVEVSESTLVDFNGEASAEFVRRSVLERLYSVSTGLMCEVYKACAYQDVARLREMPELDRSVMIAQYERLGGMSFDHVIESHRDGMLRVVETANLILEAGNSAR